MSPEAWFVAIVTVAVTLPLVVAARVGRRRALKLTLALLVLAAGAYWLLLKNADCSATDDPDVSDELPGDCFYTPF